MNNSDHKLRVGIISVDGYAVLAHSHQLRKMGRAEATAACRRDERRLKMVQKAFDMPYAFTDWQTTLRWGWMR
jgi:predicted dehydrogenase